MILVISWPNLIFQLVESRVWKTRSPFPRVTLLWTFAIKSMPLVQWWCSSTRLRFIYGRSWIVSTQICTKVRVCIIYFICRRSWAWTFSSGGVNFLRWCNGRIPIRPRRISMSPGCAPNTMKHAMSSTDHCFTTHCTFSDSQHQLDTPLQPLDQCNPQARQWVADGHHILTGTFQSSFSKPARSVFIQPFWVRRHLMALKVVQWWPTSLARHMRMIPVQFCRDWLTNQYTDNSVTCWCCPLRTCPAFQNWWITMSSTDYSSVRSVSCGRANIPHLVSRLMH